ncbi:MAG: hypothetical protein DRN06_05945 [Thermoprotei archaeon]|nr:MAG: hypothetical protein DRN06_05945 [Thermoprotei archaeon]
MIVRLSASDAFLVLLKRVRRVDALVLCEGAMEALVVEKLSARLRVVSEKKNVAVIDCEGLDALRRGVLPAVLALVIGKVVRRAKVLGVLIDLEELDYEGRLRSLLDGIKARGYDIGELERVCEATWRVVVAMPRREAQIVVSLSGIPEFELERHTIEDHLLYLKVLEGAIADGVVSRIERAGEAVSKEDVSLLDEARGGNLEKAFGHVLCLLRSVDSWNVPPC